MGPTVVGLNFPDSILKVTKTLYACYSSDESHDSSSSKTFEKKWEKKWYTDTPKLSNNYKYIWDCYQQKKKDNNYPQKKTVKITTSGSVCIKL